MNTSKFAELKAQIDLVRLIDPNGTLRKAGNEYHGPCPFCGGRDRFRIEPDKQSWTCREGIDHCGRHGDCFDFVELKFNLDKAGAYAYLSNGYLSHSEPAKPAKQDSGSHQYDWTEQKRKLLASHETLLANKLDSTDQCRTYLAKRGITEATIKAFTLGWEDKQFADCRESRQSALAVSLPWFDSDDSLAVIKFRYLEPQTYITDSEAKKADPKPTTETKNSRGAWKGKIFGWQAFRPDADTLVIVEGEFNALSIWQATPFAVLSPGSKDAFKVLPADLIEVASQFQHVIVWTDGWKDSAAGALQIPGALILVSRTVDGKKRDANQCLLDGTLAQVLDSAETLEAPITFSAAPTEKPDLSGWKLDGRVIKLIEHGYITGSLDTGERKDAEIFVINSLSDAGATPDEVRAVFEYYPIGSGKGAFAKEGLKFLKATIGHYRAELCNEALADQRREKEKEQRKSPTWPYSVQDGRLIYHSETMTKLGPERKDVPIADFIATITQEQTGEFGERYYVIEGRAKRGGAFKVEIDAEEYSDPAKLVAKLDAAAGARDTVYSRQRNHIGPAIKKLTPDDVRKTRVYHRTGWIGLDDQLYFLLPGREPPDTAIRIAERLPYRFDNTADLSKGLDCLDLAFKSLGDKGAVVLAAFLLPPLAYHAKLHNYRYTLFLKGLTGAMKTATMKLFMCLYGPDWIAEENLIKLGPGATLNALMTLATHTSDLPFPLDNYKPNTGDGAKMIINLIHTLVEGGDKERLNRTSFLKDHKRIRAWPVITGEDIPRDDAATLARTLLLAFDVPNLATPEGRARRTAMFKAHDLSRHLCAVGAAWVDWLVTPEAQEVIKSCDFGSIQERYTELIVAAHPDAVNPLRIATNLALNHYAWTILSCHPTLGEFARQHEQTHDAALTALIHSAVEATTHALEAERLLLYLRGMINGGTLTLLPKGEDIAVKTWTEKKRDPAGILQDIVHRTPRTPQEIERIIGWHDGKGGAYINQPEIVIEMVKRASGDRLGEMSKNAIYDQLDRMGALASQDKRAKTKTIRIGDASPRTLHLSAQALAEPHSKEESEAS